MSQLFIILLAAGIDCRYVVWIVICSMPVVDSALDHDSHNPPLYQHIDTRHCLKKAASIIKDPNHSVHALFSLLPLGREY